MKNWVILAIVLAINSSIWAENNASSIKVKKELDGVAKKVESNTSNIKNETNTSTQNQLVKHLQEQMKREENFAKTQSFLKGDDYNLSEHQVDPKDLESIPVIEPDYDFNMDDVYD